MSVLVLGMEMPTSEEKCKFFQPAPFRAPFCVINGVCHGIDYCTLVPIPPHGDLIDRREAIIDANERAYDFWLSDDEVNATIQFLKEQPTIIPAEEGEA